MALERLAIATAIAPSSITAVRFRLGSYSAAASDQCFSSSSFGLARPARLRSTIESLLRWVLALASAAATPPGRKRAWAWPRAWAMATTTATTTITTSRPCAERTDYWHLALFTAIATITAAIAAVAEFTEGKDCWRHQQSLAGSRFARMQTT